MRDPEDARIEIAAKWVSELLDDAGREILRRLAYVEIERIRREEPEIDHDTLDRQAGNFVVSAAMRAAEMRGEREAKKARH